MTNASGRYVFGSLSPRHYPARATMSGYDPSPVVTIGYLETSKTLDFELAQTGLTTGPMTVTSIDPAAGSTGGGTPVIILGAGFAIRPNRVSRHRDWNDQYSGVPRHEVGSHETEGGQLRCAPSVASFERSLPVVGRLPENSVAGFAS